MRRSTFGSIVLAVIAFGEPIAAQEAARFSWDHEGYAALPDAAARARESGKRLLLGLSGSPT